MRNDRGGVSLTAERLMKSMQQLRQLEADVLNVLCDLGYRDDSKEWQWTVEFCGRLVATVYREKRLEVDP